MEARKKDINKYPVHLVPKNASKGGLSLTDPDLTKGGIDLVDDTCYTGQGQLKSQEFMERLAEKT